MEEQTKKQKKSHPLLWFTIIIFLIVGVYLAYWAILAYLPNSEQIPFRQYFPDLKAEEIYIVLEDKLTENAHSPIEKGGEIFLPADFVKENIDEYLFWDEKAGRVTITTDYTVTHFGISENIFFKDETAYLSSGLLMELYNVEISFNKPNKIVIVDDKAKGRSIAKVVSKTSNLRYEPDKKSPIGQKLAMETMVVSYEERDEYTLVRTSDGLLGYVLTKDIMFERTVNKIIPEEIKPYITKQIAKTGRINILWEQVFSSKQSHNQSTRVLYNGLDVLCPTWFKFDSSLNGDIIDIADKSYVDWAHENGMQVWAMVDCDWGDDIAQYILNDSLKREYVIDQLLNFVSMYELDGINIDFENFTRKIDGVYFVQFIRELAPPLKERGVILSVDMLVPKPYNMFYNRTEVGKSADFVIIMAYDEYDRSGGQSGPVASIDFVDEGIFETLKEVPKEKIILGIPYYNRIWTETETAEGVKASPGDKDYDMAYPYSFFTEQGAEFVWDDETQNYYAEYEGVEKGVSFTKKVWLEDERSIEEKLRLVKQYDLAGVAGWKKDLEKEAVWDLLFKYLKK